MSKTVAEIGMIVGGLAVAALAGPVGIIALQGNVTVFNAMVGLGIVSAVSGVGLALRQTPQAVGAANKLSFNDGVARRRVIYGQFQTAGVLTYATFPPSQNQTTSPEGTTELLHLVYTLTGHEITSFDAVIVDGTFYNFGTDILQDSSLPSTPWQIQPGATGTPSDFYWEHMLFEFDGGCAAKSVQPFPNLANADNAWTSNFLQRGCAKVHVILRYDSQWTALYPSGRIPTIEFLVTGKKLADPRITTAWADETAYPQYSYVVDNDTYIWFQQTSGSPSSGVLRPAFESNDTAGATLTDGGCTWYCTGQTLATIYGANFSGAPTPSASSGPAVLLVDGWQGGFSGPSADQYVIEAPTGYFQLMTTAGTTGSTRPTFSTTRGGTASDSGAEWTCLGRSPRAINPSNSALAVYDYLQDSDAGYALPAAVIDTADVIAAANVCEEQELIIVNADTTEVYENLYSCNGMFDHSSDRGNVLTSLCGSMAGWVVQPGDYWHVFAGAYVTPTMSLTDNDLRAPIKGDFRLSLRDVANGVKGTYIPAYLPTNPGGAQSLTQVPGTWQSQSFPAYQANGLAGKPNYLNAEDGGQIIWQDIQLDFTTSLWTAQRLAKITLMRLRFQQTLTLPFKLTALALAAGDTFYFTHSRWGLNTATFIAEQSGITFEQGKASARGSSAPTVGVDAVARQVDPSIYEFTPPSSSTNYGEYSPFGITGVMTGVE